MSTTNKGEKKFPQGIFPKVVSTAHGTITKLSINKKQFIEYLQSLPESDVYLNLDILKRPNPTEKSTHYIVVDEWKPTPKATDTKAEETSTAKKKEDDLFDFAG